MPAVTAASTPPNPEDAAVGYGNADEGNDHPPVGKAKDDGRALEATSSEEACALTMAVGMEAEADVVSSSSHTSSYSSEASVVAAAWALMIGLADGTLETNGLAIALVETGGTSSSSPPQSTDSSEGVPVGETKPDGKMPEATYSDLVGKKPDGHTPPDPVPVKVGNCDFGLLDFGVLGFFVLEDLLEEEDE